MPVVTVELWKGRNNKQKSDLIKKVTTAVVAAIACPPEAVHVIVSEVEKENWGIGGIPASELPQK